MRLPRNRAAQHCNKIPWTNDIAMITYFSKLLELRVQLAVQQVVTPYFSWNSSKEDNVNSYHPHTIAKQVMKVEYMQAVTFSSFGSWKLLWYSVLWYSLLPYSALTSESSSQTGTGSQTHSTSFILALISTNTVITEKHKLPTYITTMKFS